MAKSTRKAPATKAATEDQVMLDNALGQIEKMFGKGSIMRLGEREVADILAISTTAISIDAAIGIGGEASASVIWALNFTDAAGTVHAISRFIASIALTRQFAIICAGSPRDAAPASSAAAGVSGTTAESGLSASVSAPALRRAASPSIPSSPVPERTIPTASQP